MFWGAQKNRLIETVLLSTHNICLGCQIRKIIFDFALLSRGLADTKDLQKSLIDLSIHKEV